MGGTTPPFRADHVGSLLRPGRLLQAREKHAGGQISDEELKAVEDESIRDVVAMQRDVGLQSATDGEFRRASWHMDFIYQLGGVARADENLTVRFRNPQGTLEFTSAALKINDKVRLTHTIFGDHFRFLQGLATDATPKLTIPSPNMVHYRGGPAAIDPNVYADVEEFWSDLATAYAEQVARLGELGCTYLQFDDTSLAYLNDPQQRAMIAQRGDDFVAEALFGELGVDGFFLEYDDARSGGFEPLRFVPEGKLVVLGLVTTKRGELEDKEQLKRRIEDASRFVPLEQLCLSPQCGFSSTVEGNLLSYEQEVAKLRLLVE